MKRAQEITGCTWAEKVIGHFNSNDLTSVIANAKYLRLHSKPMQVATERTRHMRLASCWQSLMRTMVVKVRTVYDINATFGHARKCGVSMSQMSYPAKIMAIAPAWKSRPDSVL